MNQPSVRQGVKTRNIACFGMLAAISYAVTMLCQLIPPVAGFLSFDLKGVILAIGGFLFGPVTALMITLVVCLVEMVTVSGTGPVGLLMNVLSTLALILPAAMLYRRRRSRKSAVLGLVLGVVIMTAVMLLWNLIVTPGYLDVPRETVVDMLPLLLAFNLVKGAANAVCTILIYKPVAGALRKAGLAPEHSES